MDFDGLRFIRLIVGGNIVARSLRIWQIKERTSQNLLQCDTFVVRVLVVTLVVVLALDVPVQGNSILLLSPNLIFDSGRTTITSQHFNFCKPYPIYGQTSKQVTKSIISSMEAIAFMNYPTKKFRSLHR